MITTTDPRTAVSANTGLVETSEEDVDRVAHGARTAAPYLAELDRPARAALLDDIAVALESCRESLVRTAAEETGLNDARLNGELSRSTFQFRMFADAVRDGGYLEAAIDHAGETPLGPGPDVRRLLIPIGPVAVFGSSNFPFAFSVAGGDAASALAAGSPVVFKAHGAHPLTSQRSFDTIASAVARAGLPHETVGIVYGQTAGAALVAHPGVKAVGFTGSLAGAQALRSIIAQRDDPIPFYGELASINPLVVTEGAALRRADSIASGLAGSITGSGGQLCTKPGVVLVPTGKDGDRLVEELRRLVGETNAQVLLTQRIHESYEHIRQQLVNSGARETARSPYGDDGPGYAAAATLLEVDARSFTPDLAEECFGPLGLVVRYADSQDLRGVIEQLPGSLTASIHGEADEAELVASLSTQFGPKAGRIVYNGYPTGVRVSWAQHHGGPWPATNTVHTSVGVTAMRRFLRPFVWQDAPQTVLPIELRDGDPRVPVRIDGRLVLPE